MYDPIFTEADRQLLQTLGIRCLDHIQASGFISGADFKLKSGVLQGAEHSLDCPTILYMPHCDLKLYEMVIRANWTLDGLCNIVFLANRFSDYVDKYVYMLGPFLHYSGAEMTASCPTRVHSNAASKLEKESPCLLRLGRWIGPMHNRSLIPR